MRGKKAKHIRRQQSLWTAPDKLPAKARRYYQFLRERTWKSSVRAGRIRLVHGSRTEVLKTLRELPRLRVTEIAEKYRSDSELAARRLKRRKEGSQ